MFLKASDEDIDSQLQYSLDLTQPSCTTGPNAFEIGNNGDILVREDLYQYLNVLDANIEQEQSACDYVITVTDVATENGYPDAVSSEVMAKVIFM